MILDRVGQVQRRTGKRRRPTALHRRDRARAKKDGKKVEAPIKEIINKKVKRPVLEAEAKRI